MIDPEIMKRLDEIDADSAKKCLECGIIRNLRRNLVKYIELNKQKDKLIQQLREDMKNGKVSTL